MVLERRRNEVASPEAVVEAQRASDREEAHRLVHHQAIDSARPEAGHLAGDGSGVIVGVEAMCVDSDHAREGTPRPRRHKGVASTE